MRTQTRRGTVLAAALVASLGSMAASAQEPKMPNILVLWGDDIGTWNVSFNNRGMMGYQTPSIDRIAHKERVIAALIDNDIDLAFAGAPSEIILPQLSMIVLASDSRGVIARKGHPLAASDLVAIEQLQEYSWVLPTRQLGIEDPIAKKFMERGFSPPQPLIETESWQFLMELLRSTNSLSISNQEMMTHSNSAGISFLKYPELTSQRKTGVLYVTGRTLSPAAINFLEVMKNVCKDAGRI